MRSKKTINLWALMRPICWLRKHNGEYVVGIDVHSGWICKRCLAEWKPCVLQGYREGSNWCVCSVHGMVLVTPERFSEHANVSSREFDNHWRTNEFDKPV